MGGGVSESVNPDRSDEELVTELRALQVENVALKKSEALLRAILNGIPDPGYATDEHARVIGVGGILRDLAERRRTEESLKRNQALLAEAQQLAQVGSWNWDLASGVITWSDEHYRIFGLTPDGADMTFERAERVIHPNDRALVREVVAGALRDGQPYDFCLRLRHDDGTERVVRARGQVVHDDSGKPIRSFGTCQDVTERKAAEEASRRYADRLAILHEMDRAILAAGSPVEIAQAALERLGRIVPMWHGSITMLDFRTNEALVFAAIGAVGEHFPAGTRLALSDFWARDLEALRANRVFILDDIRTAEELGAIPAWFSALDVRSYARVPLTNEGQLLGSLNFYSNKLCAFDRERVEGAREVADSLAIAIRQAQLFEEVKTSRESLTDLSRRLFRAEEAERRRIAGELHDEIGQALTALKLNLRAMRRNLGAQTTTVRLADSIALVDRTIEQVRGLSLDLRPALLDDLGLVPALRSYVAGMALRSNIEPIFVADDLIERQDSEIETACYRIAQEALTNVARHSGAKNVRVVLERCGPEFQLMVADDGLGFDVATMTARAAGGASLGLLGMRERAMLLGGRVDIASEAGRGTEVRASFSVRPDGDKPPEVPP